MRLSKNFVIEPFKSRKRAFRSDKGKSHNYPKRRKNWNLFCHGHSEANLALNRTIKHSLVMDTVLETKKSFKNCVEIRNYWKERKRHQRAKQAEKRELAQ